jgi:hypothetical protein
MPAALWISPAAPPALIAALEGWNIPRVEDAVRATARLEVRDPTAMAESELYEKMTAEYPSWIQLAKEKNLIVR